MMLSKQINLSQQMLEVFFLFLFQFKLKDTHLLCLLLQPKHPTKLTSSCQSSTPKPGLPQYLSRGPPCPPAEPRGPQTPPRPGPYPHLEVQQRPSKSLRLKGRGSKPQSALHHFLHHLSRARFRLWLSEEPRTDHTVGICHVPVWLQGGHHCWKVVGTTKSGWPKITQKQFVFY